MLLAGINALPGYYISLARIKPLGAPGYGMSRTPTRCFTCQGLGPWAMTYQAAGNVTFLGSRGSWEKKNI